MSSYPTPSENSDGPEPFLTADTRVEQVRQRGDTETYQYNRYSALHPLENDKNLYNFRNGYDEVTLKEDTVYYRQGEANGEGALGNYYTQEPVASAYQGRDLGAVKPLWPDSENNPLWHDKVTGDMHVSKSSLESNYEVKFPAGTTVYVGPAGSQGEGFAGGGTQVYIPNAKDIQGVEVMNETPLPQPQWAQEQGLSTHGWQTLETRDLAQAEWQQRQDQKMDL